MPPRKTSPLRGAHFVALLSALALAACGDGSVRQTSDHPDAGQPRSDAGQPDAGTPPVVGPDAILTPQVPSDARRGPIVVRVDVVDPDNDLSEVRLELQKNGAFAAASLMSQEHDARSWTFVWDSFADLDFDGEAQLRAVGVDPDGEVVAPFSIEVRNEPNTDRIVLAGHDLKDNGDGSSGANGNTLSAFVWSGLGDGGVVGSPRKVTINKGPLLIRAAPHGRASVVLEDTAGTIGVVLTPLDALVANVQAPFHLALPYGTPSDVRWSEDGRYIYAIGYRDGAQPAAIWRFTPEEDLSSISEPEQVATLPGPPGRFDIEPGTGRFLVTCGSGGQGKGKLLLYSPKGEELGRVEDDFGPTNGIAIAPTGGMALWTSDLFGEEVRRFRLTSQGLTQDAILTTVSVPTDILFHPLSTSDRAVALISNLNKNGVTPLVLTRADQAVKPIAKRVDLATEMDAVQRGDQVGTVLVNSVSASTGMSSVFRVKLTWPDGDAQVLGSVVDFGTTTEDLLQGLAIQR